MPTTDDEIRGKYLERAIRELLGPGFSDQFFQFLDPEGRSRFRSGAPHPGSLPLSLEARLNAAHGRQTVETLEDPANGPLRVLTVPVLRKYSARPSEVEEGVAFYGRSGNALMKSLRRLSIDPLAVYGTLCVKCPVPDPAMADPACIARVIEELAIVQPKIVVVMGEDALAVVNELEIPLRREVAPAIGEIHPLTPQIQALYVPNIDEALDDERAKREFWAAFRMLGQWWSELPPY